MHYIKFRLHASVMFAMVEDLLNPMFGVKRNWTDFKIIIIRVISCWVFWKFRSLEHTKIDQGLRLLHNAKIFKMLFISDSLMWFKSLQIKVPAVDLNKINTQMRLVCKEYCIMFTALLSYRPTEIYEVMRTQFPAMIIIQLTLWKRDVIIKERKSLRK